jgi:bacteriorhodopsin
MTNVRELRAELRGFQEATLIATDGVLRYLWYAIGLASLICLVLVLTRNASSNWLAAAGLAVVGLEVPTLSRVVAVYRRRSRG